MVLVPSKEPLTPRDVSLWKGACSLRLEGGGAPSPQAQLASHGPPGNCLGAHRDHFPYREGVRPQQAVWGDKSRDQKDLHPPADLQGNPLPLHSEGGRHGHGPGAGRGLEMFSTGQLQGWGEAQTRLWEERLPQRARGGGSRQGMTSRSPHPKGGFWPCGGMKRRHADTPANTLTPPLSPLAQARAHRCPSPLLSSHPPSPPLHPAVF